MIKEPLLYMPLEEYISLTYTHMCDYTMDRPHMLQKKNLF